MSSVEAPIEPPGEPALPAAPARVPRLPWVRLLSEALVIVASILLAFAIDTWAANRGERAQEQRYLALLFDEFTAARTGILASAAVRTQAEHASAALISQTQGAETAPEDSLFLWMSFQSRQIEFEPATAVLDDLLSSGRIQLIRSDSVRMALAQYLPLLQRLRYADAQAWSTWEQRMQPLLEGRVSRVDRLRRGSFGASVDAIPFGPSRHATDWQALMGERTLEDVLAERWLRLYVARQRGNLIGRHIDHTLRLIERARERQ